MQPHLNISDFYESLIGKFIYTKEYTEIDNKS